MRYCPCGEGIPRRTTRGHREREYCSGKCRQRAYRARHKETHDLARLQREADERWWNGLYQGVHREKWQGELKQMEESKAATERLLSDYLNAANRSDRLLMYYMEETKLQQEMIACQDSELAEKEAEIVRLTTLLNGQTARKRR